MTIRTTTPLTEADLRAASWHEYHSIRVYGPRASCLECRGRRTVPVRTRFRWEDWPCPACNGAGYLVGPHGEADR